MIDRLFLATLTIAVALFGALALASVLVPDAPATPVRVVQLEPVTITAKRLAAPADVAVTERTEPNAARAQ